MHPIKALIYYAAVVSNRDDLVAENNKLRAERDAERERADKAEQELTEWEMADNAVARTLGADYNAALAALELSRAALEPYAAMYGGPARDAVTHINEVLGDRHA